MAKLSSAGSGRARGGGVAGLLGSSSHGGAADRTVTSSLMCSERNRLDASRLTCKHCRLKWQQRTHRQAPAASGRPLHRHVIGRQRQPSGGSAQRSFERFQHVQRPDPATAAAAARLLRAVRLCGIRPGTLPRSSCTARRAGLGCGAADRRCTGLEASLPLAPACGVVLQHMVHLPSD